MAKKPNKDEYILKSDVQRIIQNYIRAIQMNDYGNDKGVSQLYNAMNMIEKMPAQFTTMRNATPEEKEHIQKYIEQHSMPTGVNFWDIQDKLNKHTQELEKGTETLW